MLQSLINQLKQDLEMDESIQKSADDSYTLFFDENIEVHALPKPNFYLLQSTIAACPSQNKELFLTKVMEANLFGRGTRNSVIGLTDDEKFLTLSAELASNSSYKQFKEKLEDFVTIVDFWRSEALNHQ